MFTTYYKKNLIILHIFRYFDRKFKHKDTHWSVQSKKKNATGKALEHFDDFYKTVYKKSWPTIRQGLLGENKYVAVVNNYSDSEKTMKFLEKSGAINMRTIFNLRNKYLLETNVGAVGVNNNKNASILPTEPIEQLTNETNVETSKKQMNSIEESLKSAEYDTSRIIHPGSTDLSSALYEFVPATKLKGKEDWISETQHYNYYETSNSFNVEVEKEFSLHFPENLNIYCSEQKNKAYSSPKRGSTNVLNYYLLDGASVLPVLALGLRPGDKFLDVCAAPGGKSLIALQTLYPDLVVCNDIDYSRIKRIQNVLEQYLYDLNERWLSTNRIKVIQEDARFLDLNGFDCILVDVPCTNDRLSVKECDNNWFKSSRTKERLQLPETQAALLSNALKMVKIGGTVVYSTCSLSPIQNDGIVNMALKHIWEETNIKIVVKDLSPALQMTEDVFKFADQKLLRYGHLIIPNLPQNYGPMYFCKLQRTE